MGWFRVILTAAALFFTAGWGLLAFFSYPFVVIADSDLGAGARQRVLDCSTMFVLSLATAGVASGIFPWPRLQLGLTLVVLAAAAAVSFESDTFPHATRWPLLAILGLVMVTATAEARRLDGRPLAPPGVLGLCLLLPGLLVLTDWQGRVYLGLMPAGAGPSAAQMRGLRRSVGLLNLEGRARAES